MYQTTNLKSITPEEIDHYELGISFAPEPGSLFSYSLDASYFFNDGRNRVVIVNNIPGNTSSVSSFKLHGLELAAAFQVSPGKTFADTIEVFTGGTWYMDVTAIGEDGTTVKRMPFTPVFSLSAGFRWTFLSHFKLSGDFNYMHDFYTGVLALTPTFTSPPDENRLRDIYILNLRMGYNFAKYSRRIADSELFFSLNNVFNYEYEYFTAYIMPGFTFTIGLNLSIR